MAGKTVFCLTPQQPPTSAADEDPKISTSLEAAAEENAHRTSQPTRVEQQQTQSEEQCEPGGGENWAQND